MKAVWARAVRWGSGVRGAEAAGRAREMLACGHVNVLLLLLRLPEKKTGEAGGGGGDVELLLEQALWRAPAVEPLPLAEALVSALRCGHAPAVLRFLQALPHDSSAGVLVRPGASIAPWKKVVAQSMHCMCSFAQPKTQAQTLTREALVERDAAQRVLIWMVHAMCGQTEATTRSRARRALETALLLAAEHSLCDMVLRLADMVANANDVPWGRVLEAAHTVDVAELALGRLAVAYTRARALDNAAAAGNLAVLEYLHTSPMVDSACSASALDRAARAGHLTVLEWITHTWPAQRCSTYAVDAAAGQGHLAVLRFLDRCRTEGGSEQAPLWAASGGHLDTLEYLHTHMAMPAESYSDAVMVAACKGGSLRVLEWLWHHQQEPPPPPKNALCSGLKEAVRQGYVPVVRFCLDELGDHATPLDPQLVVEAVRRAHIEVVDHLVLFDFTAITVEACVLAAHTGSPVAILSTLGMWASEEVWARVLTEPGLPSDVRRRMLAQRWVARSEPTTPVTPHTSPQQHPHSSSGRPRPRSPRRPRSQRHSRSPQTGRSRAATARCEPSPPPPPPPPTASPLTEDSPRMARQSTYPPAGWSSSASPATM